MLLGIDIGTTHSKVGVYSADGGSLSSVKAPTPSERDAANRPYFPPAEVWRTAAGLVRRATEEAGVRIDGVAVSSMGEAGVPVDESGRPTYPIIPWHDARSGPQLEYLTRRLEPARWYQVTGLFPNPIHTIAKWLWLQEHEPAAWNRSRQWLSVSGYIGYRLSGRPAMEPSQAARTMAYDVGRGEWSAELLGLAGLTPDFLPPLEPAAAPLGGLTAEAAELTGLPAGTPVFSGGHDHICAAFACGAVGPRVALDSQGTAEGLTLGLAGPPRPAAAAGFGVGPHVVEGHSYLLGGVYSAGGSLRWVKELLGLDSFEALGELAASVGPGEAPLFIARFHGAAPPFNDPDAKGAFLELTPEHGPAHLARAVYEGIAFELRAGLDALERVTGSPVELVRMVGGTAADPFWAGMRAAVLGRQLELARYSDMVTLGAALLAGLGAGVYRDPLDAVERTYRPRRNFTAEPASREAYAHVFPRYLEAAGKLGTGTKVAGRS